jgi:hypothetical protein
VSQVRARVWWRWCDVDVAVGEHPEQGAAGGFDSGVDDHGADPMAGVDGAIASLFEAL